MTASSAQPTRAPATRNQAQQDFRTQGASVGAGVKWGLGGGIVGVLGLVSSLGWFARRH
ncbi:hypothetical protein [Levilactobacillus zymae]|uniref:hypothetical protein n=1 Tax=Levilactobacillus zymae TaxID=267363 RepID=UPI0028B6F568|nr:hypothetical protein [Levilactobacillus zymae]MDT6979265.1 hypothetical protein [Levilactobacillus zymae]